MTGGRRLAGVALLALAMTVSVLPADARPPERLEEPIAFVSADVEQGLVVFWNIGRQALCAWADGGYVGPPPVHEPVPVQLHTTGNGVTMVSFHAARPLELWTLDADAQLQGPCEDTASQTAPWATGSANISADDNDLFVSGTRTNSYGYRGQGAVTSADGARWHYSWLARLQCDVGCDVTERASGSTLVRMGSS